MKNLVLIDFSTESINALKYAIQIVKELEDGQLELINVSDITELSESKFKLDALKEEYSTIDLKLEATELTGELMETLPDYINHEKTGFVFCGTHDIKLLERLFISRALKLMHDSKSNFVFVPSSLTESKTPQHILLPIVSDKHSLQKLEPFIYLKHFLGFQITLCTYEGKEKGQGHNLYVASKILNDAHTPYSTAYIGNSEDEFLKRIEELAVNVNADAISIVDFTEDHIFNFGAKGFVEDLIRNNNGIGIFVIGNKLLETYSGFHTSGGY